MQKINEKQNVRQIEKLRKKKERQQKASEKQQEILAYILDHVKLKGYPPSVREIGVAMSIKSTSTVHSYLERLEEDGFLFKDATKPRALRVLANSNKYANLPMKEPVYVPIVGKVTAGEPILATENIQDTFPLPEDFVKNSNVFMLKVKGDSMIDAGILNDDYIFVNQQQNAMNGDIVVALINDESTVKRFFKESDHIRLQPENKLMEPILVSENISILGKVIGVFRKIQ